METTIHPQTRFPAGAWGQCLYLALKLARTLNFLCSTRHHNNYLIVESKALARQFTDRMTEVLVGADRCTPLAAESPEES